MHGQNIIRKRENDAPQGLQVHDVWYTIQGEGPFMGEPAIFVRLTGCNVACFFCDTIWNDASDPRVPYEQIIHRILEVRENPGRWNTNLVVITGGEPLRQPLRPLIAALTDEHKMRVQIESNGTLWDDSLLAGSHKVTLVVSPKTPRINMQVWERADAFKYVIRAGEISLVDGLPKMSTQREGEEALIQRPRPNAPVFVSPCDEGPGSEELTKLNTKMVGGIALKYGYRVNLQMHKYLELP